MGWFGDILGRFSRHSPVFVDRDIHMAGHWGGGWRDEDGNLNICQHNAYDIATSLAEVAYPIDMIADRVSILNYRLLNEAGKEVDNPPKAVKRLLEHPNALASLPTMMYDAAFILMSDGNLVATRTRPSLMSDMQVKPENIASVQLRPPGSYIMRWHHDVDIDYLENINEAIREIEVWDGIHYSNKHEYMGSDVVYVGNGGRTHRNAHGGIEYRSPLLSAQRNINNLIVVYEARYRAYTKNPFGIILSPKMSNPTDLAAIAASRGQTDRIHRELSQSNGITGYDIHGHAKKMWAITGTAMQATKTLATIAELQPFEETREDALQIAGLFDVDSSLVPTRERASFTNDNKEAAEANLYDGIITSMSNDVD